MHGTRTLITIFSSLFFIAGCQHTKPVVVGYEGPSERVAHEELGERVVHNDPVSSYRQIGFNGWIIRTSHRLQKHQALHDEALEEVRYQLHRVETVLPAAVIADMKKTEIWLEYRFPGVAQYHPSEKWLVENGYNPRKAKAIELPFVEEFLKYRHAAVITMLHELFHAWHNGVIGFDDPRVIAAHKRIVASGKYKSVMHLNGRKVSHYALSNDKEYFAEMSEAYFLVNDYYPFVRAELKQFDPKSYKLMKEIWTEAAKGSAAD